MNILSVSNIVKYLDEPIKNMFDIEIFPSLASTNVTLKKLAADGAPTGKLILAESQSKGHGRFDRPFFSPAGTGIYLSLLLRPEIPPADVPLITTCAAVAVANALESVSGNPAQIKWINDIFVGSKKVCGILTEASFSAADSYPDYVVLGIGINVFEPEGGFPDKLLSVASSAIFSVSTEDGNDIRGKIIAALLNNLMKYYPTLSKREFLNEYRERSLVLGRTVRIMDSGSGTPAKAIAIDDNCNLVVELSDGTQKILNSGEISVKLL